MYAPSQVASYYASFFPARHDVYSRWTPDGWRPLREELTAEIVLAGLKGTGPSISGYMIAPGSVTHSLAIDFDTEDGLRQAQQLAAAMAKSSIWGYVETSRRGAHLWVVLDERVPAIAARRSLKALLQSVGLSADDDKRIELRPGTDRIADDGLGHALRLPLMPHPKTGRRGQLIDPVSRDPIGPTVADVLLDFRLTRAADLLPWAERYIQPPVASIPSDYHFPHRPYPEDESTASQLLSQLWGVANARPGRSVHCPAHDDKMASLSILRDDRRAICKSGSCILNNDDHGRGTYELRKLAPAHE